MQLLVPYKGDFEMILIQPKNGSAINEFASSLSYDDWTKLLSKFKYAEVELSLPKVNFDQEQNLTDELKSLGIPTNGLKPEKLGLNQYCSIGTTQRTYGCIDEEGTVVAAVTGSDLTAGGDNSSVEYEHVVMNVNSPFLFFIRNCQTGSIIMAGRICNI